MTNYIYKTYYLNYNWFCKDRVDERSHLMWQPPYSGSPCIDAQTWDTYKDKVVGIKIKTEKRLFKVSKDTFEKHKELIDYGFGQQYGIPRKFWVVKNK